MVVLVDEGFNLSFEVAWQEVVGQQNAVLQGLMPRFNFALGLGMIRCTARVLHAFVLQLFRQFARDVAGTVVAEQTRCVDDVDLITTGRLQGEVQRIGHVWCPHAGAELPRDDVTAVIIKDRAEIKPPPANDLEVGEVRLPQLMPTAGPEQIPSLVTKDMAIFMVAAAICSKAAAAQTALSLPKSVTVENQRHG